MYCKSNKYILDFFGNRTMEKDVRKIWVPLLAHFLYQINTVDFVKQVNTDVVYPGSLFYMLILFYNSWCYKQDCNKYCLYFLHTYKALLHTRCLGVNCRSIFFHIAFQVQKFPSQNLTILHYPIALQTLFISFIKL